MKDADKTKNKILDFNQPAEFFIKKAEKHFDAGNFIQALKLYRQVLGMEPTNVEYLLSIAQIYSEMGLYAESNDVLLKIARFGNTPTECLFALGCNYMGMKKYDLADEAFEQYLAIDPEGEFADEIDELFGIFEDDEYDDDDGLLRDVNRQLVLQKAYTGKEYLDKGDYKQAIDHLESATKLDDKMFSAMNNLALSYFFNGEKEKAVQKSKEVLRRQPSNLHACCNLALFYSSLNDHESAADCLSRLSDLGDISPEDMHKVALTYCELGFHSKAYKCFQKIVCFQPYDIRILHFCGIAAYNYGLYAEASEYFVKILMIDPKNSLAAYYKTKAEHAKSNGAGGELEYVYQVQFDEIKRRINYLNVCLQKNNGNLSSKWENDKFFKSIILWGLYYGDEYIKKISLQIMSMFKDDIVEAEFRDFLLRSTETDEIKNDVFMYLKRMGAKEPYVAYIKGAIAEVRVGDISEDLKKMPAPYSKTLDCFIKKTRGRYPDDFITYGLELLTNIAEFRTDGKWISSPNALAAALEYIACELSDIPTLIKKELSKMYGTTPQTLGKYLKQISPALIKDGHDVN